MEKNYERQNEQLRRNIELLEQGITVKKYLQIENDIEVEEVQQSIIISESLLYIVNLKKDLF